MALLTAFSRSDILNFLTTIAAGDTIQVGANVVVDEFLIPKNIAATASNPVTIRSASVDKPAIFRGISVGSVNLKGNFAHLAGAPQAAAVVGLVLDGLSFVAERFTSCKDKNGVTRSLIMPDGEGIGWRVCGTSHPAASLVGYSENAGSFAVKFGSGAKDIIVRNCTFNGFAKSFSVGGSTIGITAQWNGFYENCEDMMIFGGFNGLTLEWNECRDFRGISSAMGAYQGWTGVEPPHADWWQQIGRGDDLTIRNNYMNNDDYRVHGALIRHSAQSSGYSKNVVIDNNENQQSHATGMLIGSCDGLTLRRNKITGLGPLTGGGPVIYVGPSGTQEQANIGTLVLENNESTRIGQGSTGNQLNPGSNGNAENNNPDHYPSGFVQIRREKVASGQQFAGPYGGETGVIMPTKPVTLTNIADAVMAPDPVVDPDLPGTDQRRTRVIKVRKNGLAGGASEVRWQTATDTVSRGTIELTGDSTHRYFRMYSNNESHLLYPGDAPFTFRVLYVDPAVSSTARSDLSTFSLTFDAIPADPGEEVFVPDQVVEFSQYRGFYYGNTDPIFEILDGLGSAINLLWQKPMAQIVGFASVGGAAIPQPASPASYVTGDQLYALAYRNGSVGIGSPGAPWSELIPGGVAGNGSALSLLTARATSAAMALGTFPGSGGKSAAWAFRGVDPIAPQLLGSLVTTASGTTIAVSEVTIPDDGVNDNWRIVIVCGNLTGAVMTPPAGFSQFFAGSGIPKSYVFVSNKPVKSFAGATVGLVSSAASFSIAMALKLDW